MESQVRFLEDQLEYHRKQIFVEKSVEGDFDWEEDWCAAKQIHDGKLDYVNNQKKHFDDLRELWIEHQQIAYSDNSKLRIEALRAMVLVTGAAIIASISILTSDISKLSYEVIFVAKSTIFSSSISLIMTAIGHAMSAEINILAAATVRGVLVGFTDQRRILALHRYIQRYMMPNLKIAQYFIYGAIGLFGFSALVSAIVLISI